MLTFSSTHSFRTPFFFRWQYSGDAFMTPPGYTGSKMPCRTILSSLSLTLSCSCRGICLALQNICCDRGMSFTCSLYLLPAGSFLSHTVLMPFWVSLLPPSSTNLLSDCTTAGCRRLYLFPFNSTLHVSDPRSVRWGPSYVSGRLIFPSNWDFPSSVHMNDDNTRLPAPVSTFIFTLGYFTVMYSMSLKCLTRFPVHSIFATKFKQIFDQTAHPLPQRSCCAGRTYHNESWFHFCIFSQIAPPFHRCYISCSNLVSACFCVDYLLIYYTSHHCLDYHWKFHFVFWRSFWICIPVIPSL